MKAKNTYLITQPIFGVKQDENGNKLISHTAIINFGEDLGNGMLKYVTKDGEQVVNITSLPSSIIPFKLKDISLENLMDNWKRQNNCFKPIVLDESIHSFEVFENKFSPLKIMVERREFCTAIKPVFE